MVVSGSIGALTESNGFYTAVSRGAAFLWLGKLGPAPFG